MLSFLRKKLALESVWILQRGTENNSICDIDPNDWLGHDLQQGTCGNNTYLCAKGPGYILLI